jgi:hypothetical protein
VATIVDYQLVLAQMTARGFRCAYYNSGAFAFAGDQVERVRIVGWIGPDDPSIRADLPATLLRVGPPYEQNLTRMLRRVWPGRIDGPAWVVPKAHWSFELNHGNRDWLASTIERAGLDPQQLLTRTDAAAVAFEAGEVDLLETMVESLLINLSGSDFAILFPRHTHLLTIHHHKQLWWQTTDEAFAEVLAEVI